MARGSKRRSTWCRSVPAATSPSLHKDGLVQSLQPQSSEGREAEVAALGAPQSGAGVPFRLPNPSVGCGSSECPPVFLRVHGVCGWPRSRPLAQRCFLTPVSAKPCCGDSHVWVTGSEERAPRDIWRLTISEVWSLSDRLYVKRNEKYHTPILGATTNLDLPCVGYGVNERGRVILFFSICFKNINIFR